MKLLLPFSEKLKQLRRDAGFKQLELADASTLSRSRIASIEAGARTVSAQELEILARVFNCSVDSLVLGSDWTPRPAANYDKQAHSSFAVESPYLRTGEFSFEEKLKAARKLNPRLLRILEDKVEARPNFPEMSSLFRETWVDSGPEVILWCQVGAGECFPVRQRLPELGLRDVPLVCPGTGLQIGDVPRPGYWLKSPVSVIFFPQITLRLAERPLRVDCLACFGSNRWVVIEVDGYGHNSRWDDARDKDLPWPVWRLSTSDVQEPDLVAKLIHRFHETFPISQVKAKLLRAS